MVDADSSDVGGLAFRVSGDGLDQNTPGDAFFTINARTGDLIQLRVCTKKGEREREREREREKKNYNTTSRIDKGRKTEMKST